MAQQYSEKRDFIRMQINSPAEVQVEQDGTITHGTCNDLSGSGMLITVDEELPIDSELVVTVSSGKSGSEDGACLQARCTIARSQPTDGDKYLLGLEIQEVLDEHDIQVA